MTSRLRSSLPLLAIAALAQPASAVAQDSAPPAAPQLHLAAERVGGKQATVLAGTRWRVRGVLEPYVAGQSATVRIYRDRRKIAVRRVAILPSSTGRAGYFLVSVAVRVPGTVTVRATHTQTPELGTIVARPVTVSVLPLQARPGSGGPAVRLLQRQLAQRGYVVGARGLLDARTARAVLAFRKVTGMARTASADAGVFRALARGAGFFRVRFPGHGKHIEADLSRQVIALIDRGRVQRIYPTSSGAPGTPTILGSYRVYMKAPGYNAKRMYYSSFFIRGYAIHGFDPVPVYNASHGCLRVPVPDAVSIFTWLRIGERVDVYR